MTLGGSNSDGVAQDQICAFVERIMRMREEAKAINDDIREIYAEAKGNGFDKTVLGQVVSYLEKRAKDADTLAERSALFDLYLSAIDAPQAHARARAREIIEEFPPADASQEPVAADLSGGEGDALSAEQAEPSDAAVTEGNDLREPLAAATGQILREGDAPLEVSANVTGEVLLQQVEHPESNFEPRKGAPAVGEVNAISGVPEVSSPTVSIFTPKPYAGPRDSRGMPRPVGCMNLEHCGSATWRKACHTCERALSIAPGGEAIAHHGRVS